MCKRKGDLYDDIYRQRNIQYEKSFGSGLNRSSRFFLNRYQVFYNLLNTGKRILYIRNGNGDFLFMVESKFKELYGVDISKQRISKAIEIANKKFLNTKISFEYCDVDEDLQFDDSFYGSFKCISILEHVLNPSRLLSEVRRVPRLGGAFIKQVPNIAWLLYRVLLLFGKLPTTGGVYLGSDWEQLHNFIKMIVIPLLNGIGIEVAEIKCGGEFNKIRNLWPSLLGANLIIKSVKVT